MEQQGYGKAVTVSGSIIQMSFLFKVCVFLITGNYVSMDTSDLPPFWLAYLSDPSDSGRIHSNIRQRWLNGTASYQSATVDVTSGQVIFLEKSW